MFFSALLLSEESDAIKRPLARQDRKEKLKQLKLKLKRGFL
jgi:hypothetical protein